MLGTDWLTFWTAVYAVAAVGTLAVLGLGAKIAVRTATAAIEQVHQTEKSREATLLVDVSRRWDNPFLADARRLASTYGTNLAGWVQYFFEETEQQARHRARTGRLRRFLTRAPAPKARDGWFLLQRVPNFFEDMAVLESRGALSFGALQDTLGGTIVVTWDLWKDAIEYLREREGYDPVYSKFQALAEKMRESLREYELP